MKKGEKGRKPRIAFWMGSSFLTASLGWLITYVPRLVYGEIPVYETFIPITLLSVGSILVCLFHDYA